MRFALATSHLLRCFFRPTACMHAGQANRLPAPSIALPNQDAELVSHIALDIGGSLIKLVYFSPDPPEESSSRVLSPPTSEAGTSKGPNGNGNGGTNGNGSSRGGQSEILMHRLAVCVPACFGILATHASMRLGACRHRGIQI